jgi:hypothetical protein
MGLRCRRDWDIAGTGIKEGLGYRRDWIKERLGYRRDCDKGGTGI